MNLRTEEAWWLVKNGLGNAFPRLTDDCRAEVVVLGAGITGALAAYTLAEAGLDVVVLEKRHPGFGSTAASTALLQYEIDEPLHKLMKKAGRRRAEESYLSSDLAIDAIHDLIKREKLEADFSYQPSVQYASYRKHVPELRQELKVRRGLGLEVEWLEPEEIRQEYGITAPGALRSAHSGRIDPYRLVHGILSRPRENLRVFDRTEVTGIDFGKRSVTLRTAQGFQVKCRRLVIACGYESRQWLPFSVVELLATYAVISKPVPPEVLWKDKALLWDSREVYLYIRSTGENRVLFGGRDDPSLNVAKRNASLHRKAAQLCRDMRQLMPQLVLEPDFQWAGTFGSTRDSLAYIGSVPQLPHTSFILGYGGNGIVFSQTGAGVVRDEILGRKNPFRTTFAFDR